MKVASCLNYGDLRKCPKAVRRVCATHPTFHRSAKKVKGASQILKTIRSLVLVNVAGVWQTAKRDLIKTWRNRGIQWCLEI
jgi:hypothetical protein